jgi:hypothetical protein
MDYSSHGTHVAGIIAAVGNNSIGVIGVAPKAKIMALHAIHGRGDKSNSGTVASTSLAMRYAVNHGAQVINNSWTGSNDSQTLRDEFLNAYANGVTVITASGNYNNVGADASFDFPANSPNVITVAATHSANDDRAPYSNYGDVVTLAAPGSAILSTVSSALVDSRALCIKEPLGETSKSFCFDFDSGTSMAVPHVAGVAALILAANKALGPDDVKKIIKLTADPFVTAPDQYIGVGRVNAKRAVAMATITNPTPTCTAFTYSEWGACQANGLQTRILKTSTPSGCFGGSPITTQTCRNDNDYELGGFVTGSRAALSINVTFKIANLQWQAFINAPSDINKRICLYAATQLNNQLYYYYGNNNWKPIDTNNTCPFQATAAPLISGSIAEALDISSTAGLAGIPIYIGYGIGSDPINEMASSQRYKLIGNVP